MFRVIFSKAEESPSEFWYPEFFLHFGSDVTQ